MELMECECNDEAEDSNVGVTDSEASGRGPFTDTHNDGVHQWGALMDGNVGGRVVTIRTLLIRSYRCRKEEKFHELKLPNFLLNIV